MFIGFILGIASTLACLYLTKFIVDPIINQANYRYEIAAMLKYYANVYTCLGDSTAEERQKAYEVFRGYGSWIESKTLAIRHYAFLSQLLRKPSLEDIKKVSGELIGLANSIKNGKGEEDKMNRERREKILKLLSANSPEH